MCFFKKYKYWIIIILIVVLAVAIDLLTKSYFFEKELDLISGVISIFFIWNPGAAWGILGDSTIFLILFSIIIIVGILIFNNKFKQKTVFYSIGIGLVIGGAIGNLVDRLIFGAVRDFISLDFLSFINFPILNLADAFLTFGAIILVINFLFFYKEDKSFKKSE
ncbi:MAG: signal peptidase II [Clostridia bacterium]|nr:signal peptidase II [Clostridia bacterium]MDD4685865.1 signal peptidase II [Clostridia bacterium]